MFQQSLPSIGPGKLEVREDPNVRAGEVPTASLNPATDFYKKMALDCSAHQVSCMQASRVSQNKSNPLIHSSFITKIKYVENHTIFSELM